MKIIKDGHCYIQIEDMMHLFRNDNAFPRSMYYDFLNVYAAEQNKRAYFEVETELYSDYIKNSPLIYSFDYLMSRSLEELDKMCYEIKKKCRINSSRIVLREVGKPRPDNKTIKDDFLVKLELDNERRNKRYLLSQIEQSLLYRKSNIEAKDLIGDAITMRKAL